MFFSLANFYIKPKEDVLEQIFNKKNLFLIFKNARLKNVKINQECVFLLNIYYIYHSGQLSIWNRKILAQNEYHVCVCLYIYIYIYIYIDTHTHGIHFEPRFFDSI